MGKMAEMRIPPCPHCGARTSVFAEIYVTGTATQVFAPDGTWLITEIDTYEADYTKGIKYYCASCDKQRNDVRMVREGDRAWLEARENISNGR